ncbi:MAG TPA: hypothetical protein P5531_03400 [Bacteroidales bacterium]|nr:hypothetical protein [Bacteroidales bacterium]HSA42434.1 hypothetical protein [Bacteroidales bacterium]
MSRIKQVLLILTGGFILCFWAFYNHYPITFWDTGAYLYAGYHNAVPLDRPIIYGLFLRHVSMADSLWLVVLAQGLIVSLLVYYYFYYLTASRFRGTFFLFYIFLLTFLTGASFTVSTLMPDIFTSVALLSLGLLLMVRQMKIRDLIIICFLFVLGISVHNSHIMIVFTVLFVISILWLFRKFRLKLEFLSTKKLIISWILLFCATGGVSLTHHALGKTWAISRGTHMFMMARLADLGILQDYLQKNCWYKDYRICAYKDEIPWDFLWDAEKSPVYKTGGWEANRLEYNAIIQNIFRQPEYTKIFISRSFESSFKLFFSFDTGEMPKQYEGTNTFTMIQKKFGMQVKEYFSARQCNTGIDFTFVNKLQLLLLSFGFFALICLLFSGITLKHRFLIAFILGSLYINALICAAFSGVFDRYQSRIAWMLLLPLMLMLADPSLTETFFRRVKTFFIKLPVHE